MSSDDKKRIPRTVSPGGGSYINRADLKRGTSRPTPPKNDSKKEDRK